MNESLTSTNPHRVINLTIWPGNISNANRSWHYTERFSSHMIVQSISIEVTLLLSRSGGCNKKMSGESSSWLKNEVLHFHTVFLYTNTHTVTDIKREQECNAKLSRP